MDLFDALMRHPFFDRKVAFKGGTALSLFYRPFPRLSINSRTVAAVLLVANLAAAEPPQTKPRSFDPNAAAEKNARLHMAAMKPLIDTVPQQGTWPRISPNAASGFLAGVGETPQISIENALQERF